ncbi:VIT1/CCC1 transporter family protein [Carnobacterium gallinarum]|uniref:VIT1/CCC1 transporter family protein n=1 Tax=Carnobacterium gallinarum TaxID=2749 RepID=UPI000A4585AD
MKKQSVSQQLNVLRAGVLGANDGIVSVAGIVIGVAGATAVTSTIFVSGLAGLVAGALSMAGGEYVSVSTQKDTEKAMIEKERLELKINYQGEVEELAQLYVEKGLSNELALQVSQELMEKDALEAHSEAELGLKLNDYANPWQAALSSMISFSLGAILPLLAITLLPESIRIYGTFLIVLVALAITGYTSAYLGKAPQKPAIVRNVLVGMLTMIVTYLVGRYTGA